ncbi:hypothetical protein [Pseudomonas sp.]|uniref:hypothetical protein n=1 Tax=Pseudomonas sp. TaxID=306 RepID=UPI00326348DF
MCNCKQDTESRLVEALAEPDQLPEGATKISARLTGYAMMLGENLMRFRQVMPIEVEFQLPTKAGVMKLKKQKMSMTANYCMFCGEKYE